MGLVTQKNNLGPLTPNSYDVWDLCPAPSGSGLWLDYSFLVYSHSLTAVDKSDKILVLTRKRDRCPGESWTQWQVLGLKQLSAAGFATFATNAQLNTQHPDGPKNYSILFFRSWLCPNTAPISGQCCDISITFEYHCAKIARVNNLCT